MRWYLLVIFWFFISLVFSNVEHFSCAFLVTVYLLWRKKIFRYSATFTFFILSCVSCLYILEINSLSVASLQIIFSHYIVFLMVSHIFLSHPIFKETFKFILWDFFLRNCLILFYFCSNCNIFDTQSFSFKENFSCFYLSYILLFMWWFHCKNHWFQYHYIHIPPSQIVFELYWELLK